MIKVDSIEFIDKNNRSYKIDKYQIENFPFEGGGTATQITTKVWNQHGNTFIDSFMDEVDGELIFAIFYHGRSDQEIVTMRRELTDVCNPLNGVVEMKITLNTGDTYSRDITFTAAPGYPIGYENRNPDFQKVRLEYEVHDPFWYAEQEIVESFQAVQPLFDFPFQMSTTAPVEFGDILPANIATNNGQVASPVSIRVTGACTNPKITNQTTGEFIKLNNLTMIATDTLEINTGFGEKSVLLNGASIFSKLDPTSTFFSLELGENEIDFTDDTNSTTAKIYFTYKELYISI